MDEPLIRYKNVNINQQELGVLEDVNLELNKGEFVYLIGKVGSGKTSLLKTIYGELSQKRANPHAYVLPQTARQRDSEKQTAERGKSL